MRLTRYEEARLVSARALQLSMGAPPLVKVPSDTFRSGDVALIEFEKKAIPLSVVRISPDGDRQVVSLN
jgi:DNA-directed RNA polymerase I, II, and III subunit RPABC2